MLFRSNVLVGIASGRITLAFRRWRRPSVKAGGRLRTPAGVLAIRSVETISEDDIGTREARRAGYASRPELLRDLDKQGTGTLFRIAFKREGEDPRNVLRAQSRLSAEDRGAIERRLDCLDQAAGRPWTARVLRLIGREPGTRAADIAASLGESDLNRFKSRVRKLKELGLTESLEVGYRLSPRGRAFLAPKKGRIG